MVEYFEEIDITFKEFLQVKSTLFGFITSSVLTQKLSSLFDELYLQFDNARGSCTQSIYKKCVSIIEKVERNLDFVQKESRSTGEALYSKISSPHNLMEQIKVSFLVA